jgi:hypothetical protein
MPGLDQTVPSGQGQMTGRRMVRCRNLGSDKEKENTTPSENQNEKQPENFAGKGFGFRRGRGWRGGRGIGRQNRFRGGL